MKRRDFPSHIIVHCSDTPPGMDIGAETIRGWHKERGWDDIGYHFVIVRDGGVEQGRAQDMVGVHVKGWNHCSVGICLVGGGSGAFDFTRHQMDSLKALVHRLKNYWPDAVVLGHRDFTTDKTCPNFNVQEWWQEMRWRDEDHVDSAPESA